MRLETYTRFMESWTLDKQESYPAEFAQMLATWQDSTREWRANLEDTPDGFSTWRVYPRSVTAGAIAIHMAACERWWIDKGIFGMEIDESDPIIAYDLSMDQYDHIYPDPPNESWDWYIQLLDSHRAQSFELLAQVDDPTRIISGKTS